jgi:hypothetical protein
VVGNGEGEGGRAVRLKGKMGKSGKSDLKIGLVMAWLECVRTYISAFDRTRAWRMWCKWA